MTALINASTSSGVVVTSDTSGSLALQTNGTTAVTVDTNATTTLNSKASQAPLITQVNGTEAMRVDSSGNLLLNTTSQAGRFTGDVGSSDFTVGTTGAFLNWKSSSGRPCIQVQSISNGQDVAFRNAAYDGTTSYYWTIGQNIASSVGNLDFMYNTVAGTQTTSSGSTKIRFTASGQVYNSTGTYGTISDIKLKENIVDATPKLEDLLQLKVRNFTLKADETKAKQLGFIAQEVQEVFPACVEVFDDIDPDTKEKTGETLTVKTAVMIPMLVKAMQEQQAMIEELKAEVAALKGTA